MSCNNWEKGTITIPAKEWAKFRTSLIKAWNEDQLAQLETLNRLHAKAEEAVKGQRGAKRQEALRNFADRHEGRESTADIIHKVIRYTYNHETKREEVSIKPAPKKKDLKLLPVSKSCTMEFNEASIQLSNEGRTVTWRVAENNRAVEDARKHRMGRKLFALLSRITWTRGSGGKIIGNDEYTQDADGEGEGGNYVTDAYGPDVKRPQRTGFGAGSTFGRSPRRW